MGYLFDNLSSFEEWFFSKLLEEKNRRINYIKKIWDKMIPKKREKLLKFIDNNFLLRFVTQITSKYYDELYVVIKDHIENSFEIIEKWEKKSL